MKATHCWQVDGAWRGVSPLVMDGVEMYRYHEPIMVNYHTGKIEAVPVAWLRPYPQGEIPTP